MSGAEPPGRGMLFAETQLRRHGWRRGQGLGRREDGIAEAIRVKVKCDTAGVSGWGSAGRAAPPRRAVEQAGLGHTFPAAEVPVLAARGRCRGARHGLTMSAKLARLEEQERAFLATYRQREQQQEPPGSSHGKKKKRKQSRDGADPEEPTREQEEVLEEEKVVKRKKKKQGPSREEELTGEEEVMRKKKKKKKVITEPWGEEVSGEEKVMKSRKKPELSTEEEVVEEEGKAAKRRKKKKKKKEEKDQEEQDKEEPAETDVPLQEVDERNLGHSPTKKRKKKRKREPE